MKKYWIVETDYKSNNWEVALTETASNNSDPVYLLTEMEKNKFLAYIEDMANATDSRLMLVCI